MATLVSGIHVLTNGPLDEPFFKAQRGKEMFSAILKQSADSQNRQETVAACLRLLQDKEK